MKNKSIDFFETQFRRQVTAGEYALNPFEQAAAPFVSGRALDLGCGLGNLSIEAARKGTSVTAVDASPAAIQRIQQTAATEKLDIQAVLADLDQYAIQGRFDTVIAIGLLMFFRRDRALKMLNDVKNVVAPGGKAIVNVLVEGTTYLDMFDGDNHYLFGCDELADQFSGWRMLLSRIDSFDAPNNTKKIFLTVIAEKPG